MLTKDITKEILSNAVKNSFSTKEVLQQLELEPIRKNITHINFLIRHYMISIDHFPLIKMQKLSHISKDELEKLVNSSTSLFEILRSIGSAVSSKNYGRLIRKLQEFNIDYSKIYRTNTLRGRKPICIACQNPAKRKPNIYCSNKCQIDFQYKKFIENWKSGSVNGNIGINSINLSRHLRRFLFEKFGEQCCLCGWKEVHSITKKIPLQVNHIDGNFSNNLENNLQLLCPNCHSLTPNFGNLNKGNGRAYRKKNNILI